MGVPYNEGVDRRRPTANDLLAQLSRARAQQKVVAEVSAHPAVAQGDLAGIAGLITERVGHLLTIDRVGVWLFNDQKDELVNLDNFQIATGTHSNGAVLKQSEFTDEFRYLVSAKYVDANDPYTDPRTSGYVQGYLKPNNISAMLDAVIRMGDELIGTLCFEYVGIPHIWQEDEIIFASQLGDQVALTMANSRRKLVEAQLSSKEQALQTLNAELERRVRERTAELQAINEELESFSYSVSHDLRAPIRSVVGFGSMLKERAWERLDEEERRSLDRILAQGDKMNGLINDLLRLAKTSQSPKHDEVVDISALCERICSALRQQFPSRNIAIDIQSAMAAFGDKGLLHIAFENILGNAMKFTAKTEQAAIQVRAKTEAGMLVVSVSDNGAGFDGQFADRLFAPFQRLHQKEEFDGTGIGLATVRRVVVRHRGEVDIVGVVGKGATVTLRLPLAG